MTDAEVFERFEVCWRGGELLPSRESASTLAWAVEKPARKSNPMIRVRSHGGARNIKYSQAQREAVRAMRAEGYRLRQIAERFAMPINSVTGICNVGRDRP